MLLKNRFCFMLRISLLLVCMGSCFSAYAQVQQVGRYEIEQLNNDEDFIIIPLKKDGLALFRKKFKFEDRSRIWELILLDNKTIARKTLELAIDNQGELVGYEHSNGFVHFLFIKNQAKGDMEVVSINLQSYDQRRILIKTEMRITLTHFNKCGDNFVLGGTVAEEPAVFVFFPATNNFKIIPGFFKKRTELIDVRVNENQTFNTILISRENRDNSKIIFRTFDSSGKQLIDDEIAFDGRNLQTGISSNLKRDDLMILGTYGALAANQSSGFYAVPVNPFADQKIEFSFLGQLEHYLDYMKPKRAERIKEKTERAVKQGRYPDYANYIIPHSILEHEKGFILLAETYIPTRDNKYSNFNSNNNLGYNPYSYGYSPYTNGYMPYYPSSGMYNMNDARFYGDNINHQQEVRTVQSQIILFDPEGKIISDYSIKLDNVKIPMLNQVTDFYLDKNELYFLYKKESELIIKTIDLNTNEISDSTQEIKLSNPTDISRSDSKDGRIRHWYNNSFYMYGYQVVRSADGKSKDVFYINRVQVN